MCATRLVSEMASTLPLDNPGAPLGTGVTSSSASRRTPTTSRACRATPPVRRVRVVIRTLLALLQRVVQSQLVRRHRRNQERERLNAVLGTANRSLRPLCDYQTSVSAEWQLHVAEVAHDIGNELQDLKLMLRMLRAAQSRRHERFPAELQAQVAAAEESITAIDGLLSTMIAIAQLDAGALQVIARPTDLPELLQGVTQRLGPRARDLQVSLKLTLPPLCPPVLCDPELISRALLNIGRNAIQYTAQAWPTGGGAVEIGVSAGSRRAQVSVTDNGPGIEAERLAELGQHFVRGVSGPEAPAGFGLGLAFARGVVEQHPAGALRIGSTPGKGTTVTLTLETAVAEDRLCERAVGS